MPGISRGTYPDKHLGICPNNCIERWKLEDLRMIKKLLLRLCYGLLFALPLMFFTFAMATAEDGTQDASSQTLTCPACHSNFQSAWERGAHAQTATNTAFKEAWEAGGSQGQCLTCHVTGYDPIAHTWHSEAITCLACHDASNAPNHPNDPMPADRSSKLCGDCHQETFFEWQVSAHRESGLSCIGCHDPHGTELKKDDPQAQCSACHRSRASNYAHSEHSKAGLSCADCHLADLPNHLGEGQARLDHSFTVRLSTCNECHAYQMHDPVEVHPERTLPVAPVADAMAAVETLPVTMEPLPVSPVGFATLAGLFGLAAGAILGPWIERRTRSGRKEE
jgi:formate-dependent nitrite reductase cytochrome c552 subunit